MVEPRLSDALNDCIDRLARGQTLDDCLRLYPAEAAALRPMLEAGLLARRALPLESEAAAAAARQRSRIAAELDAALTVPRAAPRPAHRWLALVASLAVVFAALLVAGLIAAETSLPGDALYPVKRFSEGARLVLSGDPALAAAFADRRRDEVRRVLALGRELRVDFRGEVESMTGASWQVSGIAVRVPPDLPALDTIAVSDLVEIEGYTADGFVRADRVTLIEQRHVPAPQPAPTAVQTQTPFPSPSPAPPATATPTLTPSPSASPTATPSRTLAPTSTLTPSVTGCVPSPPAGWVEYVVRAGDTLSALASTSGASLDTLLRVNCVASASLLSVGQRLYLPSPPAAVSDDTPIPFASGGSGSSGSSGGNSGPGGDDDDGDDSSGHGGGDDDGDDSSGHGSDDDDNDDHDNSGPGSDDDD